MVKRIILFTLVAAGFAANSAGAKSYGYDGVITACDAALCPLVPVAVGDPVTGSIEINVGPSDSFALDTDPLGGGPLLDLIDFSFEVAGAIPLDPLPCDPVDPACSGVVLSGSGTTDADGNFDSGTITAVFVGGTLGPLGGEVEIDLVTGTMNVTVFGGATFVATVEGGFTQKVVPYDEDFEGLDIGGALIGGGWQYFINVFDGSGNFQFGYGGEAPNGPQISAIATGEGGTEQGDQQLSVYSDYNCCDVGLGHQSPTDRVETNVFVEQTIDASNVGETWVFSFDAKQGNIEGASTALAFLKVLDPNNGFSQTAFITEDTTSLPAGWSRLSLEIEIGSWAGQILQIGFLTDAGNFEGSGNFYDNIEFGLKPPIAGSPTMTFVAAAACNNLTTPNLVFVPSAAPDIDCTAAGFVANPGDLMFIFAAGIADCSGGPCTDVGETITGFTGLAASCRNTTTGQSAFVLMSDPTSINCSSVVPGGYTEGDLIQTIVIGNAD